MIPLSIISLPHCSRRSVGGGKQYGIGISGDVRSISGTDTEAYIQNTGPITAGAT